MIKIGDEVKLKNPKKREAKRRWRVIKFLHSMHFTPKYSSATIVATDLTETTDLTATTNLLPVDVEKRPTGVAPGTVKVRRLDTATHRLECNNENNFVRISFWERITKRW